MGKEILTYDDLLQIVELIKSAEAFSEFHLKIGDIELDLRKSRPGVSSASSTLAASPPPAAPEAVKAENSISIENDLPGPAPYIPELPGDIAAGSEFMSFMTSMMHTVVSGTTCCPTSTNGFAPGSGLR